MFSKNSNKALFIVFAVLLAAVIIIFSTESTKKERSFRKDIVSLDTGAVTSFSLFPKSKPGVEVKFLKNDGIWTVTGESAKSFTVPKSKIDNIFNELSRIQPKRIAARSKSKWTEYQVDSSATRIVVNESGEEVLDLIIGKFSFQQPRSMSTFVRLSDETDVSEVDGFLEMTFNKDINSFRNETIIRSESESWNRLTFDLGNNDSFELVKIDGKWNVNGTPTDSSKTEKALTALARLTNTNFIDDISEDLLPPPTQKLLIELSDNDPIEVLGYKDGTKYLIHSSLNPENYFDGEKVADKIFIKKESLF